MSDRFGFFINGTWTAAQDGRVTPVFSPVTVQVLGNVPVAGVVDTETAIASATAGFAGFRTLTDGIAAKAQKGGC